MTEILELTFFMWLIAVASFAPLGYFIYLFTFGDGSSFGKSNPEDHAVEHTKYYQVINTVMERLLGGGGEVSIRAETARPTTRATQTESALASGNPTQPQASPSKKTNAFSAATWDSSSGTTKKKKSTKKSASAKKKNKN